MDSVLDLKSKEEKDAELDRKIEALRKKNEALVKRHQMIELDRKMAEQEGFAVTTLRKAKNLEGVPDKARKEKENFSITFDVSAGEKRVVNDGKSPKGSHTPPSTETSPRSSTHKTSGRIGAFPGMRVPHMDKQGESFQMEDDDIHPPERSARGRRGQAPDMSMRSPQVSKVRFPGEQERWSASPRGAERGGRGPGRGGSTPGRGGGTPGRGGSHIGAGDSVLGPDKKVKEWEERRKQNIEKMNEEMEKIAEYERSQRDGVRDKNPIRNFLDDPRRTGPVMEADRKEGSRRHNRNWGGPDFEKVKTGMDWEKKSYVRKPGVKNQMDMTMSMTGKERAEYVRWKQERDQIDQERLARHRKPTGQWRREWDAEKTETMFKEGAVNHAEDEQTSRRDQGKRGTPKPATMAEFLPESFKKPSPWSDQKRVRGRNKPYNMHDSRWEEEEDTNEKKSVPAEEKETCVEKAEEKKAEAPQKTIEVSPAVVVDAKRDELKQQAEDGCEEDDGEWTDASGVEDDDDSLEAEEDIPSKELAKTSPAPPQEKRLPRHVEAPKLTMPSPSTNPDEHTMKSKPTSPFSPEEHRPVTDWGEEMELLSPPGSSNEDSPQAIDNRLFSMDNRSKENFSPSGSSLDPTLDPVQNVTSTIESEAQKIPEEQTDQKRESPESFPEEKMSADAPLLPVEGDLDSGTHYAERLAEETLPIREKTSPVSEEIPQVTEAPSPVAEEPSPVAEEPSPVAEELSPVIQEPSSVTEEPSPAVQEPAPVAEELDGAGKSVHIADYETESTEVPPSS